MKLGIGTYTYMWSIGFPGAAPERPMTARDLLSKAAELGTKVVQYGPNLPLSELSQSELDDLIVQANRAGVEIEVGTRGLEAEHLTKQILLSRRLGSRLLRTVPELGGRTPALPQMRASLEEVLPELERNKVRLALENGRVPAEPLARMLKEIASEWIGITLDTVNSLAVPEGTREVVKQLAKYTFCFHVKDFVVKRVWHMMGFTVEGRPADEGQMDLPWILEELRAAGSDPNAILELWPPEQPHMKATIALEHEWARTSILNLRKYIPN